jgi:hypothetical protein
MTINFGSKSSDFSNGGYSSPSVNRQEPSELFFHSIFLFEGSFIKRVDSASVK